MIDVYALVVEIIVLLGVWVNTMINLILYKKRKNNG